MKLLSTIVSLICYISCIVHISFSRDSSECNEDCEIAYSCTGIQNCSCRAERYKLQCSAPDGMSDVLYLEVKANSKLEIHCIPSTTQRDYELLRGLRVGPVINVYFQFCPLPSVPLSEFLPSIGITAVTTLKFQSHRDLSNTFDGRQLMGLKNVTRLLLMSNNLTELPENLLHDMPQLTWLDLKENNLQLPKRFFENVPNLEVLELGHNKLMRLDPGLLSNLSKLRLLNLWRNNLRNITRGSFSGLSSLEQLDLSSNAIVSLPSDVFHDLESLHTLSIFSNNFTRLPDGLLAENRKLEIFRLHDNHQPLTLAENLFSNLVRLKEIRLMRNNIPIVPENIFWGSFAVTSISLQGNALTELPRMLFRDQRNLQDLDLSHNLLQYLPDNVFGHLESLKTLKLGYNKIGRTTRKVFYGLKNLELLDMEHNELHFVEGGSLLHLNALKTARFSHNRLSFHPDDLQSDHGFPSANSSDRYSPFRKCLTLEHLYLANNSITEIFYDWRFTLLRLRTLDLSYNKIEALSTSDIQFLAENLSADLRQNNISVINLKDLEILARGQSEEYEMHPTRNVSILLEDNPLNCDCCAYDLFRYFERKLDPRVYLMVTLVPGKLKCDHPESFRGARVRDVASRDLTCSLNEIYKCPAECECKFRLADSSLIVNCTAAGLTDIPGKLPQVPGTNHTELLLERNRIRKLPNFTSPGYERVTHLYLSLNNITDIDSGMFSRNLEVLVLDGNDLSALSSDVIRFLRLSDKIRILTLHNNPWRCDCSATEFLDLIQQKFKLIPFLTNVTCSDGNEQISKLSISDLCPVSMAVLVSCIFAAIFGLVVGSLAAFYYRYQREVKVWLYSHRFCLWFVTEEELDRDKVYDAFVSFSHKDENFVINTLVPELESGENPFKLCLHYRDWIAGEWIPNQIARSVENSRRTLVVLSPNFLESVWSRMEFRAAHKQALSEGRARVIVLLYGDVGPTEDLDPELRAYISMNTYVKWGDPWFWGKLRYALPHPPSLVQTNLNFMRKRSLKKEKTHIDDKLELIHTPDPSGGSPPGGTTPPLDGVPNGNKAFSR